MPKAFVTLKKEKVVIDIVKILSENFYPQERIGIKEQRNKKIFENFSK